MINEYQPTLALFYCQNIPESSEQDRQALEKKYGRCIRLFPVPCSGRVEPIHLLRALEEFADMAYVLGCAEGNCHYFEGNQRVKKRVARAKMIISAIGLEEERLGIILESKEAAKPLAKMVEEIFDRAPHIKPSPVLRAARPA
jgi:F420-non-reducing hydrogenase iron-sulfur subunit